MVIELIIGLRITADQQRPEQTGGRRCETIRTGENDNSREKMQNVRGDSSGEGLSTADMEKCVWVRPETVARIEFFEWTDSGHLRHSKFAGLRDDKNARSVVKEQAGEP